MEAELLLKRSLLINQTSKLSNGTSMTQVAAGAMAGTGGGSAVVGAGPGAITGAMAAESLIYEGALGSAELGLSCQGHTVSAAINQNYNAKVTQPVLSGFKTIMLRSHSQRCAQAGSAAPTSSMTMCKQQGACMAGLKASNPGLMNMALRYNKAIRNYSGRKASRTMPARLCSECFHSQSSKSLLQMNS
eukprot:1161917-Pelagomonas_calceolata.AAC.19